MTPAEQQLLDALAKEGTNLLPYVKYAALAVGAWYVFVALVSVVIFGLVIYQFIKIWSKF